MMYYEDSKFFSGKDVYRHPHAHHLSYALTGDNTVTRGAANSLSARKIMSARGQRSVSMALVKTSLVLEQNASRAPNGPVFTSPACLVTCVNYLSDARQTAAALRTWNANIVK